MRQFISNNGVKAQINANVVARLPSTLEVWDRFSVEIRRDLRPVPNLIEDEHLQIWQLFEAGWFACFFPVKRSHLHIVPILNTQRKSRNILMRVCLLFGLLSLVLFWQLTREWGMLWKGAFYKHPVNLQAHYSSLGGPTRELLNFWKDSALLNSSSAHRCKSMCYIAQKFLTCFGFQILAGWNVFDEARKTN